MTLADLAHLALAAAHGVLAFRAVPLLRTRTPIRPAIVIVWLIAVALVWDNLVLGLGNTLGAGDTLRLLSWPRFATHAVLTPMVVVASQQLAAAAGSTFARRVAVRWTAVAITAVLILQGFGLEIIGIHLEPVVDAGVLRYTDPDLMVPIGSIAAVVAAIWAGVVIRRQHGDSTLLVGSIVMFVASGAQPAVDGLLIGNPAEVVFVAVMFHACRVLVPGHATAPTAAAATATAPASVPTAQPQDV